MSDYEVTLVNDNSQSLVKCLVEEESLTKKQCMLPEDNERRVFGKGPNTHGNAYCRQEFYVRFKGPEESTSET